MKAAAGTVLETVILKKRIEVSVADSAGGEEVERALREEAYRTTVCDCADAHGWQVAKVLETHVSVEGAPPRETDEKR